MAGLAGTVCETGAGEALGRRACAGDLLRVDENATLRRERSNEKLRVAKGTSGVAGRYRGSVCPAEAGLFLLGACRRAVTERGVEPVFPTAFIANRRY
jgi:hypothetical protein